MRDLIKTVIVTAVILICIALAFLIVSNVEQGIELLTRTDLPKNDPDVKILYEQIEDNTDLRKANLVVKELSNKEIIELVMNNLTKNDYTIKTIEAEKIVCQVTDSISFNTEEDKCRIRIINNDVFTKYMKNNYNIVKELEFNNFEYRGYNCENSGKKYYCTYNAYKDPIVGYSLFDKAYKTKDSIVISEYYVQINLSDGNSCKNYFDEEYCANYKTEDRKDIKDKIIKKDGVIYEHVFTLVDGRYYLEKSYVKNEG